MYFGGFSVVCLGKSDNGTAARNSNPARNPLFPWGDLPIGEFEKTRAVWFDKKTRLGEAWIPIEGVAGDALEAKKNGRYGLGIHAGRGSGQLVPTHGCLRLLARDFFQLLIWAGNEEMFIRINEGD